MTKQQIIAAINTAFKAWEHTDTTLHWSDTMDARFAAMQTLFLPIFDFIKADVDFRSFVPWYHNYFSLDREINDDCVIKFMVMSAGCFE